MNSWMPGLICRWYLQPFIPEISPATDMKRSVIWEKRFEFSSVMDFGIGALMFRSLVVVLDRQFARYVNVN